MWAMLRYIEPPSFPDEVGRRSFDPRRKEGCENITPQRLNDVGCEYPELRDVVLVLRKVKFTGCFAEDGRDEEVIDGVPLYL